MIFLLSSGIGDIRKKLWIFSRGFIFFRNVENFLLTNGVNYGIIVCMIERIRLIVKMLGRKISCRDCKHRYKGFANERCFCMLSINCDNSSMEIRRDKYPDLVTHVSLICDRFKLDKQL